MKAKHFLILHYFLFTSFWLKAQDSFQILTDEKTSKPMLVGLCDRNAFADTNFSSWFKSEYDNYNVDTSSINLVSDAIHQLRLTIVLGTWCSDSREQIPRLLKILDFLNYPADNIQMFAVDRNKKAGGYDIDSLKIELVPSIIFYKENAEVGRIVETPQISLEEDIVDIIYSVKSHINNLREYLKFKRPD